MKKPQPKNGQGKKRVRATLFSYAEAAVVNWLLIVAHLGRAWGCR